MRPIVLALGGNALAPPDTPFDLAAQHRTIRTTAARLAPLCRERAVVITHGNGPQVGWLAGLAPPVAPGDPPAQPGIPLDIAVAQSDALIGYEIEAALRDVDSDLSVATLLTLVEVSGDDTAFARPTKPVGPLVDAAAADRLVAAHGWTFGPDRGGLRRLVPSPQPRRILGTETVAGLCAAGVTVVCCGGGGIPVARGTDGLSGREAVIDKDAVSAMLAVALDAEALVLLTDVEGVYPRWPACEGGPVREIATDDLRAMDLPPGSMGPKAAAACDFAEATGRTATIGCLADLDALLAGRAGTAVRGPA